MTTTNEPLAAETGIVLRAGRGHRLRRLAMTYGHAERNLAFIRQLEAETRQLTVRSAVGRVPHLTSERGAESLTGGKPVARCLAACQPGSPHLCRRRSRLADAR